MSKKLKKGIAVDAELSDEGTDIINSSSDRSVWQPEDADAFHWILSESTHFENGILCLDHRYMDPSDTDILIKMDKYVAKKPISEEQFLIELDRLNQTNPSKNFRRCYYFLCKIREATNCNYDLRQINTKHINTRSRWSVPFKSLNEVGYLVKNQSARRAKNISANGPIQRTNIAKKNLAAIKAIRKLMKYPELYWNSERQEPTDGASRAQLFMQYPELEETSEPDRWIRAMIKRHGSVMMEYLNQCGTNLANSFIKEANHSRTSSNQLPMLHANEQAKVIKILGDMIDVISKAPGKKIKSKPMTKTKSVAGGLPALDIYANIPSINRSSSSTVAKRGVTFSMGPEDSGIDMSEPTTAVTENSLVLQNPVLEFSSLPTRKNQYSGPPSVKRSKSHVFDQPKSTSAEAHSVPTSVSLTNMAAYSSLAPVSSMHNSSNETKGGSTLGHGDDGLFSQFINYENMGSGLTHSNSILTTNQKNMQQKPNMEPTELVDAIVNLSVENGTHSFDHSGYGYIQNPVQNQMPPYYASSYPISAQEPISNDHAKPYLAYPYNKEHFENQIPKSLSRTVSDESTPQYSEPQHNAKYSQQQQNDAREELQNIFGNKDSSFTFQLPSYKWLPENSNEGSAQSDKTVLPSQPSQQQQLQQHGQQMPGMVSESFSMPSLADYARSMSAIGSLDTSNQVSGSFDNPVTPLSHMYSGTSPCTDNSTSKKQRTNATTEQPSQSTQGKSQLSTTLIIVNGVPSHIELTHNNSRVHPNPIILPISQVIRES
ncbi:hypothetical protein IWW36_003835 [Coemansia brasiliensis]|uniref:Uncharacterized protein n=1 Tax=Coemansia brasiliensis TaxID=2650707 RepID=A0A9W8I5Q0_9FUNG|nr:hypothetical protein IWW36_003835 [Coemansia brasiliensis]